MKMKLFRVFFTLSKARMIKIHEEGVWAWCVVLFLCKDDVTAVMSTKGWQLLRKRAKQSIWLKKKKKFIYKKSTCITQDNQMKNPCTVSLRKTFFLS